MGPLSTTTFRPRNSFFFSYVFPFRRASWLVGFWAAPSEALELGAELGELAALKALKALYRRLDAHCSRLT